MNNYNKIKSKEILKRKLVRYMLGVAILISLPFVLTGYGNPKDTKSIENQAVQKINATIATTADVEDENDEAGTKFTYIRI